MNTVDYYNDNAEEFYNNTVNANMEELYRPFLELIPKGGKILDAGCGSGRDTLYFWKQGYKVTAFDASEAMVKMSSKLTGQECLRMTFEQVDFIEEFDGVWACASLLHVPRSEINDALFRLARAVKTNGIIYASFKYGNSEEMITTRFFNNYDEQSFDKLLKLHSQLELIDYKITEDVRPDKKGEKWLNVLAKKVEA